MTTFVHESTVTLEETWGSDHVICQSARVSTGKDAPAYNTHRRQLLYTLIKNGHGTPFEHAGARFRITAPIFVLRQLMRHRIASWNEKSLRYTAGPQAFYINPEWDADMTDATVALCTAASRWYTEALERGTRREVARVLLPVNVMSEVVFSANMRSLMNFLALRNSKHAQVDARLVAQRIEALLGEGFPLTIGVFNECGKKAP